jgi:hypothetical protein
VGQRFINKYEPNDLERAALNKIVAGRVCMKIHFAFFENADSPFCKTLFSF